MSGQTIRVDDGEISRDDLRWVESMVRRHPARRRALRKMEAVAVLDTPNTEGGGHSGGISDGGMLRRAMVLGSDPSIAQTRAMVKAVEETYEALPREQREIIRLLYWERRLTVQGVADHLGMNRATVWRQRTQALTQFALVLLGDWVVRDR